MKGSTQHTDLSELLGMAEGANDLIGFPEENELYQAAIPAAPVIHVNMFGMFSLWEEGMPENEPVQANLSGRSRRLWVLIAYLIVNRDRGISPQELIDLLWPEATGSNPASKLQNNVSRARKMLTDAGFTDAKNLLKYEDGVYRWAPERKTLLDADEFETQARSFERDISPEELPAALAVCDSYRGDFLMQAANESWVAPLSIYYRSLFTRLCRKTLKALLTEGRIDDVERLCLQVIDVDPTSEEFSIFLMRALTRGGNPQKALDHYDRIRQIFSDLYGVNVSTAMEMERELALQTMHGRMMDEEAIRNFLEDTTGDSGAFFCSNAVFREIVHLHEREMQRSGIPSQVAAISFVHHKMPPEQMAVNVKRLQGVLSSTLRAGDPFTKMGSEQFLVLLPGASLENGQMVIDRVIARFHKDYPRVECPLQAKVFELSATQTVKGASHS